MGSAVLPVPGAASEFPYFTRSRAEGAGSGSGLLSRDTSIRCPLVSWVVGLNVQGNEAASPVHQARLLAPGLQCH